MRTLLIFHESDDIDREITTRWLSSFSDLVGTVALKESTNRKRNRIKREIKRVGVFRFLDVLAFRFHYSLFMAAKDKAWVAETVAHFSHRFGELPHVAELVTNSPNSQQAEEFIRKLEPDIVVARCKTILKKRIFGTANCGTFVFHPGICPEYRNAHGCFWALAEEEYDKVGLTLLQVDEGIDTGPVFGYFTCDFDALIESHFVIQHRVFTDNLALLQAKLEDIFAGSAQKIDTAGRKSNLWGQPWLSKYKRIVKNARRNAKAVRPRKSST